MKTHRANAASATIHAAGATLTGAMAIAAAEASATRGAVVPETGIAMDIVRNAAATAIVIAAAAEGATSVRANCRNRQKACA